MFLGMNIEVATVRVFMSPIGMKVSVGVPTETHDVIKEADKELGTSIYEAIEVLSENLSKLDFKPLIVGFNNSVDENLSKLDTVKMLEYLAKLGKEEGKK